MVLIVNAFGTPYEIGVQHGQQAKDQVLGSLSYYGSLFKSTCSLEWPNVRNEATKYLDTLEKLCPEYLEEMRGIAEGAEVPLLDIVALNVRTEINFGLFSEDPELPIELDGCTALAIKSGHGPSFLSQNWDWQTRQGENLIVYTVHQPDTDIPRFSIVTEAGIIGKIGLNESGVGVCLNAIKARGVDHTRWPVHLALRKVLESSSRQSAINELVSTGLAGSAHLLIADELGATGLESTAKTVELVPADDQGVVIHSNHLLLNHDGSEEHLWLLDSPQRSDRMQHLVKEELSSKQALNSSDIFKLFQDEEGYPNGINRDAVGDSSAETLFNIIMNLSERTATIAFGRTTNVVERVHVSF
ncbi:hypothetical protein CEP54_010612 [Fusarium duplospermum]|uniref:Peptidase C45 hydrolase domain-containing protein n=1 Tax=Fusarium duplospermum TaxID=1325734 RepID=A0A428PIX6_9HYPO|nr:hypothetical protein CEP54_010612 [Fusarium duplospermum]